MIEGWDIKKRLEYCADKGMKTPTALHQNGCAEALAKSCKIGLKNRICCRVYRQTMGI